MAYFASMIEIRHLDDTRVIQMEIPEGALVHRELMSDHYAKLPFATDTPIYFKLGDWCYLEGYGRFELTEPYLPKYNTQTGGYDYDLRLDAHYIKWKNKKVKYMPASAASETSFSLTANIDTHLNVIINNINALGEADSNYRYYGDPFTFEFRNFTGDRNAAFHKLYDNTDILSAIYDLADICDCEAWIEDNIICFGRCELSGQEVNFEIGVNVSEMSEADSKKDYATRLYVFGSTKNLPADYRKDNTADITQNGVVQKRLMLPLSLSPHGYIQDSGVTCETEAVEAVFVDESVYPKVECEVSTVIPYETNVTDSEGNVVYEEGHDGEEGHELKHIFYRIKDANGFRLIFDKDGEEIDLRLPGEQTRIVFQSGAMNGMDFECSYNKEDDYYEIIENEDYGRALPDGDLCPAVGDTFVIYGWDASQIESTDLISVAENRLHEVGLQKLAKLKIDPTVYTCTMDSDVYESSMRSQQGAYNHHDLGQKVKLINRAYFSAGRSSRVIGYEIKLDIPYDSPDYIIGEATRYSRSAEMENMQEQIESIAVNGVSYQGGGSGNGGVYIIGSTSSAPSSDYNVYSAKRTDKMFVRKDVNDTVYGRLTHEMQDIFKKGFKIGRFISGVLGSGALIDENGNLEVESIYARSFMSASEFRYNKVSVSDGEDLCTNGFGIIKAVDIDPETPTQGYITLQLEENDYASVEVGDICRGMYNDITGEHETADLDDDTPLYGVTGEQGDIGFPCKAGYFTSYFYVMDMTGEGCYNRKGECRFKYGLRNASVPHPCQFMKFAQYGNLFNTNRQSCIYKTSIGHSYEMVLEGVNTWKLSSANIVVRKGWLGDMYVTLHDGESETQLQGNGLYVQDNVYFGNAVIQLDPYTLAQLADELSTYSAEFSDYVDVITVDDVGNVIGGLYTESGEEGHEVRDYRIFSAITVRKRNELLTIAADNEDAGEGTYKINVLPHGCSCIVQNSTLYITGINNIKDGVAGSDDDDEFDYNAMRAVESCSVDVAINCEGKGTIIRKFPVTIKHDSQPFVGADIDNEFSAVSWNTKTQTYIGLPIVLNMKMWHNNEQLNIESVNDVSVSPAITGMTVSKEIINVSGQKHARVTISALPENLGNVTKLNITAIAEYAGVSYERTLTHTINKGTDVNVYSLLPSLSEIIYNKNTGALNSNSLSCKVMCDSTDDKHYEVTLDKLATHKLKLCYQIHYNDGTATTAETDYTSAGVTGLTIGVEKVVFKLYNLDKSVQYDEEGVPVIASGQDGKGVEYVFVLTTTNTAPTITSNADWTETVDGETVTHHVTDDDFRPMTSAGRATDEPTGTDSTNIFEWVAKRVKRFNNDGVLEWEPYGGTMSLWANWSKDGGTPETRYQWNQSPTSAPPLDAQNPSATTPDSNWNVSAPNRPGDGYYLWSVTAIKNYNNTYGTWGNFVRLTGDTGTPGEDGDEKEWIYGYSENGYAGNTGQVNPSGEASGSETNKNQPGWVPNGWTDHPRGVSNSHKTEYASWRDITNNGTTKSYGAFHTPIIWSHYGERGTDGDGTEYVFIRTKINTPPEVPSSGDYSEEEQGYDADEHLPYVFIFNAADISGSTTPVTPSGSAVKYVKCTDDPVGVNDEWKYEWVLKRTKAAPVGGVRSWEPYSGEMSLWANWSKDGGTPETRYQWNQSPTSAPPLDAQNPSATTPDSNWNVSAPNRPGDGYYLWSVTAIKNYNNTYGTWGNFVRLTGDTGTPGEDGDEKEWIYGYSENGYAGNTGQVNPSGEASGSETNKNQPGWVPNGWTDHPRGVSNSHKTEYASWRDITNNGTTKSYGAFHTPIIWSHYGERGTDGDGTEYVFIRTKINTPPEVPSSGDYSEEEQGYDADEHLPYVFIFNAADISGSTTPVTPSGSAVKYVKCTDDPVGVNDEWKYEWVLKRTKAAPVGGVRSWEPYSGEMSLWAKYGDKGDPAHEIDINMLERTNFDRGLDAIKEAWVVTRDVWSKITVDSTLKVKGRSCVKIDGTDATDNYFDFEQSVLGKLKANTKYTLSFWGCNSTANRLQVFIFGDAYGSGSKLYQGKFWVDGVEVTPEDFNGCVMFAAAATPVYHTITFKTASTIPSRAEVWFRASQGTISYICMPKLEEGDTATAYIADEGDLIGPQGTSITGANVKYALADSGSTAPADSAFTSDDFPTTLNSGKYVWEATEITFSSGSPALTGKICLGPTTDFLAGTEVYAISTSNSTAPADNQFGTTYNKTKGYYLWTATRVQYTSGTYAYLNKKCVGYWGDDGTSPYQLKLSDEAALINCDENGNVLSSYELSRLMIQQGINSKFTDFNINIVPVGISCNGNSSSFSLSEETKASADSNGYYPLIPSAITVDAAEIRVIATLKTDSNFVLTGGYKINKNKTGATGKTGPSYYPAGEYDASTNNAFSRTDEMCPVVLSDGNYYYLKESSNLRNGSRISPTDQSYGSVYWGLCDNFQVVFIKALFAMFAKLGSFVVSGDWFISQYGTLVGPGTNNVVSIGSSNFETLYKISGSTISTGSGGKAAYAYFDGQDPECESAPTSGNMKFVPSLAIDAKSGTLIASNAKIRGDVKAISGQFGNLVISGNQISVQNGVFTIDSDGTTLQKRAKFAEAIFYKSTPVEITQTRALNLPSEASISAFLTNGTAFDGIHLTLPPAIEAYDGLEVRYLMGYSMGTRTTPGLYPAPLIIPSGTRIICLKSNRIIYGNNNGTVKFCMSEYKNTDYDLTDSYCKEVHLRCAMFVFYGGMTGPLSAEPVWLLLNEDDFKHTHYVLNPTTGQIVSVVDNDWFE